MFKGGGSLVRPKRGCDLGTMGGKTLAFKRSIEIISCDWEASLGACVQVLCAQKNAPFCVCVSKPAKEMSAVKLWAKHPAKLSLTLLGCFQGRPKHNQNHNIFHMFHLMSHQIGNWWRIRWKIFGFSLCSTALKGHLIWQHKHLMCSKKGVVYKLHARCLIICTHGEFIYRSVFLLNLKAFSVETLQKEGKVESQISGHEAVRK